MANFYGSVDGFIAYCEERGYDIGEYSPSPSDELEQALTRGSDYIDYNYRGKFVGTRTGGRAQLREWPRSGAYDAELEVIADDEVPVEIVTAAYEATRREIESPGVLMPDYDASARVTSERVGPLAVSYANSTSADAWPILRQIDAILAPLFGAVAKSSRLFGEAYRI